MIEGRGFTLCSVVCVGVWGGTREGFRRFRELLQSRRRPLGASVPEYPGALGAAQRGDAPRAVHNTPTGNPWWGVFVGCRRGAGSTPGGHGSRVLVAASPASKCSHTMSVFFFLV